MGVRGRPYWCGWQGLVLLVWVAGAGPTGVGGRAPALQVWVAGSALPVWVAGPGPTGSGTNIASLSL